MYLNNTIYIQNYKIKTKTKSIYVTACHNISFFYITKSGLVRTFVYNNLRRCQLNYLAILVHLNAHFFMGHAKLKCLFMEDY